jgi:hypothetical protein
MIVAIPETARFQSRICFDQTLSSAVAIQTLGRRFGGGLILQGVKED